ncbi:hypothetical protein CO181_04215 [candidate division WWE3 bacterium CG_4_9_14_3_um_filter_43_9]|nr:MAG: hypothetical protein AUJ38_03900 [bacterium CG1_02_42_9]PIZ42512.1 MAG: hypothetical protein COY34_02760 [candidate division WWE3 bacterium CG_4_10_14_0_2_um_filter_42_8]PJA37270.1 MAG: hypothetical protein CO181_04215 [candidate division WWE3 bacterium CG_4_9_14_3_um_filter_43_9]
MKIIKKNQVEKVKNSHTCMVMEYPLRDTEINGAIAEILGRYPHEGWIMNMICKELVYVLSGKVDLAVLGKKVKLEEGDEAIIMPKEKFYWEGRCKLFIACTPAWCSSQYKEEV